jgi:diguanylate cyclase (GGDEF)-like protein
MQQDIGKPPVLAAIVDYFVHPSLRNDSDSYTRARILIGAMLIFPLVTLSAFIAVPMINFNRASILIAGGLLLPTTVWFVTLLMALRHKGSYTHCSISTVLALTLLIVGGICVSGGIDESPVTQLLVVPPLTAYFFGGVRWGNAAVVVVFLMLCGLIGLHYFGIDLIQTVTTPEQLVITHFLVSFVNLAAISSMAFIYEFTSAALKQERDIEREKYMRLAKTDPLTGLANRRNFDAMLQERIEVYGMHAPPRRFALGYLDLDGFKPINDTHGHAVGDEVLRIVSERLRGVLRGSDFVGRHGGDEFMLMVDLAGEPEALEKMAGRVLSAIARPIKASSGEVGVTGSLGFAMFPLDAFEIEELKKAADAAMYAAKREHNCWRSYQPGM